MCGIFGYIGPKNALNACFQGLERLQYRGYDSTGIAGVQGGKIALCKAAGPLEQLLKKNTLTALEIAIGHTRWATHGKVSDENAHPHLDAAESIALVHNGIIENFRPLREALEQEGIPFSSETDTEVIVQLIAKKYRGDLLLAVHEVLPLLHGIFAIALIHRDHPGEIIAASRECPLSVGYDEEGSESLLSSDPNAFLGSRLKVLFLQSREIARIQSGKVEVFDAHLHPVFKKAEPIESDFRPPSKEGYDHFMLKEIHEQPHTVRKGLAGRLDGESLSLEPLSLPHLEKIEKFWILGCGTSAHAGALGSLLLEDLAQVYSTSEIASEARYRQPILPKETLLLAISQSGETADTIGAVRELRAKGIQVLSLCNVRNSTLTRESDATLYLKAGPEMSVCSTKAFTSQLTLLTLFALHIAHLKDKHHPTLLHHLRKIPQELEELLNRSSEIERLAEKYAQYDDFFFIGRHYMYPTALEAALKLKEISYVNANGYPAGELKHGPIALLDERFPVIALLANQKTQEKMLSSLMEVKARGAPLLAFAPRGLDVAATIADDLFWLPPTLDPLSPFASTLATQLLAYFIAKKRGCSIDQPRNLAKSVTVE